MNQLVSVIIPTYNRRKIINRSIQSVRAQTYTNWELLIVDDGSTDGTFEFISYLEKIDKRIKYLTNEGKKGPSGARNTGIRKSKGEYIAFLDSDDEWTCNHLEDSLYVLNKFQTEVCFSLWCERSIDGIKTYLFDSKEKRQKFQEHIMKLNPKIYGRFYKFDTSFFEYTVINNFFIYHINSTVISKNVSISIGPFDENLKASEDTDYIFRLFNQYDFSFINDVHFYYNQGSDNIYLFMNRKTISLNDLLDNNNYIRKLTFCGLEKCKMLKKRLKLIKHTKNIRDKKKCLKVCKSCISKKYFTLSYLNFHNNKFKAFKYQIKCIKYQCTLKNLSILVKMFSNKQFNKIKIQKEDLYIS